MRTHFKHPDAAQHCAHALTSALATIGARDLVMVCIGTDRSTGDSLGPLVGTALDSRGITVYGTLDHPVHAENLQATLRRIDDRHPNPFILAVDACLGRKESVGRILVEPGPLRPGEGAGKKLPPVGDVGIAGVVNVYGHLNYFVLQNTRLSVVMRMADVITGAILAATAGLGEREAAAGVAEG